MEDTILVEYTVKILVRQPAGSPIDTFGDVGDITVSGENILENFETVGEPEIVQ